MNELITLGNSQQLGYKLQDKQSQYAQGLNSTRGVGTLDAAISSNCASHSKEPAWNLSSRLFKRYDQRKNKQH